jgi:ABC-2 type transport system ATP-binding protein
MGEGRALLEVTSLAKSYGDVAALKGITFSIRAGEILGFLGPNGAGKSTTVKIVTGLLPADAGRVLVDGHDVATDPLGAKSRLGYVPENVAFYESLTPLEFLELLGRLRGLPEASLRARAEELLDSLGLGRKLGDRLSALSRGMRQKASLAAALLHDPPVLLLDEAFSGIDAPSVLVLRSLLRSLKERGRAILFCSHVLELVEKVCDRVAILSKGEIAAEGEVARLVEMRRMGSLEDVFRSLAPELDPERDAARILAAMTGGAAP